MSDIAKKLDSMPMERRVYALRELIKHITNADQAGRLRKILTSYGFVEAKILANMGYDLVSDYQQVFAQLRHKHESHSERELRQRLNQMPRNWRPIEEYDDRLDIAFWDEREFMAYINHHMLFGPKIEKNVVWTTLSYSKFCYELAYLAIKRKAYYDALEVLKLGIQIEPDHPLLFCEQGLALNLLNQHEAAIKSYKHAVVVRKWTPTSTLARALRGMAVALIDLDRLDEAEKQLNMSLQLEPENRIAREELMYIEHLRRGGSKVSGGVISFPDELEMWYWFVDQNSYNITEHPDQFMQFALNQPDESPIYKAAITEFNKGPKLHLRWINKPTHIEKPLLQRTLGGHKDTIMAVAISPDNQFIVSGSQDQTIRIWELKTGRCLNVIEGHNAPITTVVVTSDGRKILSGDSEGVIRLWDIQTGHCNAVMKDHKDVVRSIVCVDTNLACSGGKDGILRVWDLKTGKCIARLEGDGNDIQRLAVISWNNTLVSTSNSGELRRWNLSSNSSEPIVSDMNPGLGAGIQAIDNGEKIVVVVAMEVRILDTESGNCLNTFEHHHGSIKDLALTPDGKYLITAGVDRIIQITQLDTGELISTLPGHASFVFAVAVSPDGNYIISAGADNAVKVWNANSITDTKMPRILQWSPLGTSQITSVALAPDSKSLLSTRGQSYGRLVIQNPSSEYIPKVIGNGDQVYVTQSQKRVLTVSEKNNEIQEWDIDRVQPGRTFSTTFPTEDGDTKVDAFVFSPEGDKFAYAADEFIEIVSLENEQKLVKLVADEDLFIAELAISQDAKRIVSVSGRSEIRVWDVTTGNCQIYPLERIGFGAAIDLAGGLVIIGGFDGNATIVDYLTGNTLVTLNHGQPILAAAIAKETGLAVTGADDGTICVWSLASHSCIAVFHTEGPVTACSIESTYQILCGTMTGQVYLLELVSDSYSQ